MSEFHFQNPPRKWRDFAGRPPRPNDTGALDRCEAACGDARQRFAGRGLWNKSRSQQFPAQTAAYKSSEICYSYAAPNLFNRGAREIVMAKGQMRSNKEKKKPKADKNLKKGGATPSPFSSGKIQMQAGQNQIGKK